MTLFLIFLPAILVMLAMKYYFHHKITIPEMAVQAVVPMLLSCIVYFSSTMGAMGDTNIVNGYINAKEQERTSCEHSYDCFCTTDKNGHRSCSTCYEHTNDWDWRVDTTLGPFYISRVDRRGSEMPERWAQVKMYEPVAFESSYTNYVKAAPDSLFHLALANVYKGKIPNYPAPYDYHRIDRVIPVGVKIPDLALWNESVSNQLRTLGDKKQVNIVTVITNQKESYGDALQAAWIGGKKNDVTVVIGTENYPEIKWVKVFSWSKNDIVNVAMRNELLASKVLDRQTTLNIVYRNIREHYIRRPMEEFKYLENEIDVPQWAIITSIILGLIASIGIGIVVVRN